MKKPLVKTLGDIAKLLPQSKTKHHVGEGKFVSMPRMANHKLILKKRLKRYGFEGVLHYCKLRGVKPEMVIKVWNDKGFKKVA